MTKKVVRTAAKTVETVKGKGSSSLKKETPKVQIKTPPIQIPDNLTLSDGPTKQIKRLTHGNLELTIDLKNAKDFKFEEPKNGTLTFEINGKQFKYYIDQYTQNAILVSGKEKYSLIIAKPNKAEIVATSNGVWFDSNAYVKSGSVPVK